MKKIAIFCLTALAAVTIMLTGCADNGKSNNGNEEPSTPTVSIPADENAFDFEINKIYFIGTIVSSNLTIIEFENVPEFLEPFKGLEFSVVDDDRFLVSRHEIWFYLVHDISSTSATGLMVFVYETGVVQFRALDGLLYQSTTEIDYDAFINTLHHLVGTWS